MLESQLVRLTAILAGIEIITLVFFFFSMRANIKAANAAKTAADAATKGARTAELAFYTATRPWVLISDFEMGPDDRGPVITYKIYNSGTTPALLYGMEIRAEASAFPPMNNPVSLEQVATRVIAIHVPPHSDVTRGFVAQEFVPTSLSSEDWRAIQTGRKWLYCYGLIKYRGPMEKLWIYDTGFGVWHQGDCSRIKISMESLTDPQINYVR